jgi:hypothetical protein
MLSVEDAPVISVPVAAAAPVSVPLVAAETWMREAVAAPIPAPVSAPARFMSEDEEPEQETTAAVEPTFYQASAPAAVAVSVALPQTQTEVGVATIPALGSKTKGSASAIPHFAEPAAEPVYGSPSRDYAPDPGSNARGPVVVEEHPVRPSSSLFNEPVEEAQRDLDTPTFMRRLRF